MIVMAIFHKLLTPNKETPPGGRRRAGDTLPGGVNEADIGQKIIKGNEKND